MRRTDFKLGVAGRKWSLLSGLPVWGNWCLDGLNYLQRRRGKAGTNDMVFRSLVQGLNSPGISQFLRALRGDLASAGLHGPRFIDCV